MLIAGTKEWFAQDSLAFLSLRNSIEQKLLALGYEFFYSGILSKKSIYAHENEALGERFQNMVVPLDEKKDIIIAPEGTFRVYDFLRRSGLLEETEGKVFYSQEFLRNEPPASVQQGKTMSFWQIGYEIFGESERQLGLTSVRTLMECLSLTGISDQIKIRISDKRILAGVLSPLPQEEKSLIYVLIDQCNEDGEAFYARYTGLGGDRKVAAKILNVLSYNPDMISSGELKKFTDNPLSDSGIDYLEDIYSSLTHARVACKNLQIEIVPYISKSWDFYTTLLFDAWICDYSYAIAGGGNLSNLYGEKNKFKSGAGIGLTRLVDYLIQTRNDKQAMTPKKTFRHSTVPQ